MIWAEAHFCAAHSLPQRPGLHGHSYKVRAYAEGGCVEELQRRLRAVLAEIDHTNLNEVFAEPTMEEIARFVSRRLIVRRVLVERPVEGLGAEWAA